MNQHASHRELERHEVFQTGTMGALLNGIYDGDCSIEHLLTRGDFGVGTFNALDGEMLIVDGTCYRLSSDGSVGPTLPKVQTPFAVVTRFEAHVTQSIAKPHTLAELRELLGGLTPSDNYLYAFRIRGDFAFVRTRTVARQSPPYRRLVEVTKGEPVQIFTHVSGDIVGFRTPVFQQGIGISGDHAHFIDQSRTQGGHVLDLALTQGTIEVCIGTDLHLELPRTVAFERANLDDDPQQREAEVTATERHS